MNDPVSKHSAKPSKRFQFSLGSILIWTAIVCLALSNVMINRKLATLMREGESSRPLSLQEVASQFEKNTTLGPLTTTVQDVRYSAEKDAYKVDFSYENRNTNRRWTSSVELTARDYGTYYGLIRSRNFTAPLKAGDFYSVSVESPSAFEQ